MCIDLGLCNVGRSSNLFKSLCVRVSVRVFGGFCLGRGGWDSSGYLSCSMNAFGYTGYIESFDGSCLVGLPQVSAIFHFKCKVFLGEVGVEVKCHS